MFALRAKSQMLPAGLIRVGGLVSVIVWMAIDTNILQKHTHTYKERDTQREIFLLHIYDSSLFNS